MRILATVMGITIVLLLTGCPTPPPPASQFTQTIIWKEADGRADDAETPPPEHTYNSDGNRAVDNQTSAGSHVVKWNMLGGYVHAVPGDNPNEQEEVAAAISNNKAQTEIVVNQAGNFTFDAAIELDGLEIIRDASVTISQMVVVEDSRGVPLRDANGNPVPGQTFQKRYTINNDANGNLQVTPAGGTMNGNHYEDTSSTPAGGVALTPGTYWIQMELNLTASANTSFQDPSQKPEAHLNTAKLTLSVR